MKDNASIILSIHLFLPPKNSTKAPLRWYRGNMQNWRFSECYCIVAKSSNLVIPWRKAPVCVQIYPDDSSSMIPSCGERVDRPMQKSTSRTVDFESRIGRHKTPKIALPRTPRSTIHVCTSHCYVTHLTPGRGCITFQNTSFLVVIGLLQLLTA